MLRKASTLAPGDFKQSIVNLAQLLHLIWYITLDGGPNNGLSPEFIRHTETQNDGRNLLLDIMSRL